MVAKQQQKTTSEASAVDVIWNAKLESSTEKLVVYTLAAKHQLGDRVSSTYMSVSQFASQMQEIWTSQRELLTTTKLSGVKIQKALEALRARGLVKFSSRPLHVGRRNQEQESVDIGPQEVVYDLTDKLFTDFMHGTATVKTQKIA